MIPAPHSQQQRQQQQRRRQQQRHCLRLRQILGGVAARVVAPALASAAPTKKVHKIAFIGFRHGHIGAVFQAANNSPSLEITGVCEEDAVAREELKGEYTFTHTNYDTMLDEVDADIIAVGDYYTIRGERMIKALERGKHVIGDKPLCTSTADLDHIEALATAKNLSVFAQLDMRDSGVSKLCRKLIADGAVGELVTVSFGGQHSLNFGGGRAGWYFEEGKHGGTISDIGIHGIDLAQWITGSRVRTVTGARAWSTGRAPHIKDAAQLMIELENGVGVMGDVSYLDIDGRQGSTSLYWRVVYHGTHGILVTQSSPATVEVYSNASAEKQTLAAEASVDSLEGLTGQSYLDAMLREIEGEPNQGLTTAEVLQTMRATLSAQEAADGGVTGVAVKWGQRPLKP
jgi:predicted dehydrogenase